MKKLIYFSFLITVPLHAKVITLNIPDADIAIVENDVVDAEQWIKDAWQGKLNNCKKRLIKSEINQSVGEGTGVPAGESAIIQKAFDRPSYKKRKDREKTF